jgi:hypothetical protein
LGAGGVHGGVEQLGLGRGRCHAGKGAHFRVGQLAGLQGGIHGGQLTECTRHAHLLARGGQVEPNSPRQPVRTRHGTLWFPSALSIELTNAFEQPVRGRIQVNRQFRYLITQFLDGKHG